MDKEPIMKISTTLYLASVLCSGIGVYLLNYVIDIKIVIFCLVNIPILFIYLIYELETEPVENMLYKPTNKNKRKK
jgi:hypothetical protein